MGVALCTRADGRSWKRPVAMSTRSTRDKKPIWRKARRSTRLRFNWFPWIKLAPPFAVGATQ